MPSGRVGPSQKLGVPGLPSWLFYSFTSDLARRPQGRRATSSRRMPWLSRPVHFSASRRVIYCRNCSSITTTVACCLPRCWPGWGWRLRPRNWKRRRTHRIRTPNCARSEATRKPGVVTGFKIPGFPKDDKPMRCPKALTALGIEGSMPAPFCMGSLYGELLKGECRDGALLNLRFLDDVDRHIDRFSCTCTGRARVRQSGR